MLTLVHLPHCFFPLSLNQQLTPWTAWAVLGGFISSKGGAIKTKWALLLTFLRVAAVEGPAIPSAMADLKVLASDKALESQRM